MIDLLNISEEELLEMWCDDPTILDDLVIDSHLDIGDLAEVFVKHPILQESILKVTDQIELYNMIYENQIVYANPIDYEYDKEYKKVKDEYIRALEAIKSYMFRNQDDFDQSIVDAILETSVEVEDWNDPYGVIKRAEMEELLEKRETKLSSLEAERTEIESEFDRQNEQEGHGIGE